MTGLAAVLAGHAKECDSLHCEVCECGWVSEDDPGPDMDQRYYAHLADVTLAWVAERARDEAVVETVAEIRFVDQNYCEQRRPGDRCDHVEHWPVEERDMHRNGNWRSFTERAEKVAVVKVHNQTADALAVFVGTLGGGGDE